MIQGKTKSGFKFEIDERVLSDWRLLLNIERTESEVLTERVKAITELVHLLLGSNESKLMEHIAKKNDGFVPTEAITDELASIISSAKELKN